VLFIDARHIYRQIDRAHRDWTPAQIEFLANVARLFRGEAPENLHGSAELLATPGWAAPPPPHATSTGRSCARDAPDWSPAAVPSRPVRAPA
jgi:hypothetical protein